ncbi:MAG: M15 family metallopeptidase [Acidimicrobiales bacterium]
MPLHALTRPARLLATALVVALLAGLTVPAGAQTGADPRSRRREVQQAKARKAAELDVLKASDNDVERALDAMNDNLRGQEARTASAVQAAVAAEEAAAEARRLEEETAAALVETQDAMRRVAVNAYVRGPSERVLAVLDVDSLSELTTRRHLLAVTVGRGAELSDQLRSDREDLVARREVAERARAAAVDRRREAAERLDDLQVAVDAKQEVADDVEERLERALAESASLESLDKQLADEIAKRQADLARRVGSTVPRVRVRVPGGGAVSVVGVRGISVSGQIAGQVEALLAAAEADGFVLGGGGYRSSDAQAALRRANCGGGDSPASRCRPPTARPGNSMHEQGLAIDFTWEGRIITSRSSPAYGWLKENAGRFGLRNLPSEPWHWSTNGN